MYSRGEVGTNVSLSEFRSITAGFFSKVHSPRYYPRNDDEIGAHEDENIIRKKNMVRNAFYRQASNLESRVDGRRTKVKRAAAETCADV